MDSDSTLHYYFYGKWKYYDENEKRIKYVYYDQGLIIKTDYVNKNSQTNDSLIDALKQIDKIFTKNKTALTDSINAHLDDNAGYKKFKKMLTTSDSIAFFQIDKILVSYGYPSKAIVREYTEIPFYILGFAPLLLKEKHLEALKKAADNKDISWKSLAFFMIKLKSQKKKNKFTELNTIIKGMK